MNSDEIKVLIETSIEDAVANVTSDDNDNDSSNDEQPSARVNLEPSKFAVVT